MAVELFNIVVPDTLNELLIVVIVLNVVIPDKYNDDINVAEFFNLNVPDTFKILVVNDEGFVKLLIYGNSVVDLCI